MGKVLPVQGPHLFKHGLYDVGATAKRGSDGEYRRYGETSEMEKKSRGSTQEAPATG